MKLTKEQLQELMRGVAEEVVAPLRETQTSAMAALAKLDKGSDPDARPGITLARVVRSLAAGRNDPDKAVALARKWYGEDDVCVKALMAGDNTAGGFFVGPNFIADVIELLRPMSVVRSLNPMSLPLLNGSASIPKLTGGATAAYAGESQNITKTEQTTGMLNLVAKKLAALVPMSNDLLRFDSVASDVVVRDDLVAALAQRGDLAFIRGDGTSNTPKGLRYWASATATQSTAGGGSDSTPTLAEITNLLGYMRLQLRSANVRMIRPGWIFSPRTEKVLRDARDGNGNFAFRDEMLRGTLDGWPFRVTTQVPENLGSGSDETEIYLTDFADAVIGEGQGMMIDASDNAAYHDGSNVQAAFSRDETVIRAIEHHDFGLRHDASAFVVNEVTWATAPGA